MGIKRFLVRVASASLAIFLFFSSVPPAIVLAAGSLTVSGTVTNQTGGGVVNVSVYATSPGGSTALYGPTTTSSTGGYSLGIDPGTYDIHFDPPTGSGFNPIVDNNYAVATNQTLNVQLTSPQHTISGAVTDNNGNPASNLTVQYRSASNSNIYISTTTDANGHYSLTANAGVYNLNQISGTAPQPIGFVNVNAYSAYVQADITNGDATRDIVFPLAPLSVTVKDSSGNILPGTAVSVYAPNGNSLFPIVIGGSSAYVNYGTRSGTTDSSGSVAISTFTTTYPSGTICATINSSQICNSTTVTVGGAGASLTLQQPAQHTVSGTVKDNNGDVASNLTVQFRSVANSNIYISTTTDANGHYSLTANAGVYNLNQISGTAPQPIGFVNVNAYSAYVQVDLSSGDATQDITFPLAPLTITVKDSSGNVMSAIPVSIYAPNGNSLFPVISGGSAAYVNYGTRSGTTDSSGAAVVQAFTTSYPSGTICATINSSQVCNSSSLTVGSGGASITLQQPPQHTITGTLKDTSGDIASNLTVQFRSVANPNIYVSATTDAAGHYSLTANAGAYNLNQISGTAPQPIGFVNVNAYSAYVQVDITNSDATQDIVFPLAPLTVTVKDGYGNPSTGVAVSVYAPNGNSLFPVVSGGSSAYVNYGTRSGTTNSSGVAKLAAFTTSYPAGTICTTINSSQTCNSTLVSVGSGGASLLFQAAPQAPPAPTGLTAPSPTTTAPSLSWNSVSVAASYNVYRNSTLIGSTTTTNFVDSALILSGTYTYTVTAVSKLNVESSASAPASVIFNGQGPVVTNVQVSPTTISLNQHATLSANISDSFATVTAAEYFEGADPGEGHGTAMTLIAGTATASLPTTLSLGQHTFTVRGENSLGNWTRGTLPTATVTVTLPTLTGRVLNGANIGLANVRVDVVDPSSQAIIATTNTDTNGNYSVSVNPGTYTVVYAPSDPTYQTTTKIGVDLTTSNTVDVVLVLTPHQFNGTLKDQNSVAISGATVSFHNAGGQTVNATVDGNGYFSAMLNPATYSVTISGTSAAAPGAFVPANFTITGGSFDLSSDVTQNFVVHALPQPLVTRSALTLATVGNVALGISASTSMTLDGSSTVYSGSSSDNITTDQNGAATVILLANSQYAVHAVPPANSGVVTTDFPMVPATGTTRYLDLNADIKYFSGNFTDKNGGGISGALVQLSGPLGTFQATTDSTGYFKVEAAAGTYSLYVSGNKPAGSSLIIPDSYSFMGGSIDLTPSNVPSQDLQLMASTIKVTATSSFGSTLSGVTITLNSVSGTADLFPGGTFTATASSSALTDDKGVATLYVTTGLTYATKATPAANSGYIVTNSPDMHLVTGDDAWSIILDRDLKNFKGTITDRSGKLIIGATVRLDGNEQDQHYVTTTDKYGEFSLDAAPNSAYALQISGTNDPLSGIALPDNYTLSQTVSITGDTVQNATINGVAVDILARDDRLNPISGVGINFGSSGSQNGFAASSSNINRTTGSDGYAHLYMLAGTTYTIHATPQPNMGYVDTTFSGTSPITQDSNLVIEFQNHIPLAPTGLTAASPTKTNPALTWNSVTNADHYKIYRDGVAIATAPTTSFTDTSLLADGTYQYQVSAVSADNYEGPKSNTVTVLYDTTAPLLGDPSFTVNPKQVSQLSTLSATVADSGVGVTAGEYFIGATDPGQGSATAMMLVNGSLSATIGKDLRAGSYTFSVRAADALGNWSAVKTVQLVVSLPAAPTSLTAPTPTNQDPQLSWGASPDAAKYYIYRDGVKLADEPTTTTYTDVGRPDGSYTYTVTAVNSFGDESDPSNAVTVLVDKTAPTITASALPAPNSNGWNNSDVTVTFTCSDTGSGIQSCPPAVTVTAEVAGQIVSGTAVDNAGNTATASVSVSIDKTAPTVTHALSQQPNGNGWNNGPATVTFTCTDALSGVAVCPAPQTYTADGVYDIAGTALDNADNATTDHVTLQVDQTAPTITPTITPAPNSNGWNNADVVVSFTCQDNLSGIQSCPSPVTVNTEGANQQITGTAVDNAGNSASVTVPINLDKTAPVVSSLSWSANPLLQGQDTTLSATVTDSLSGEASVYYTIDGGAPQSMAYDATSGTWKATFGASLAVNTYNVSVYAVDAASNTGAGLMDVLAVYNPANGAIFGHAWVLPSASDVLPIALDTSAHSAQMVVGFSATQGATTSVDVHYVIKNAQNEFGFDSTTVDWVVVPDSTHASILVHGTLTTYVNGVQAITPNAAMRLDVVLGANGAADQISMKIWSPGLNPSTDAPTYQANDSDIPNKSQVFIM